jgi:hypothetical protein
MSTDLGNAILFGISYHRISESFPQKQTATRRSAKIGEVARSSFCSEQQIRENVFGIFFSFSSFRLRRQIRHLLYEERWQPEYFPTPAQWTLKSTNLLRCIDKGCYFIKCACFEYVPPNIDEYYSWMRRRSNEVFLCCVSGSRSTLRVTH